MSTVDLETLADQTTAKVAGFVPNSYVSDDGGGPYLYIPLTEEEGGKYLIVGLPLLFNGLESTWYANDGNHDFNWDSEYTSETAPEVVAEWVNTVVLPEAKTKVK